MTGRLKLDDRERWPSLSLDLVVMVRALVDGGVEELKRIVEEV